MVVAAKRIGKALVQLSDTGREIASSGSRAARTSRKATSALACSGRAARELRGSLCQLVAARGERVCSLGERCGTGVQVRGAGRQAGRTRISGRRARSELLGACREICGAGFELVGSARERRCAVARLAGTRGQLSCAGRNSRVRDVEECGHSQQQ